MKLSNAKDAIKQAIEGGYKQYEEHVRVLNGVLYPLEVDGRHYSQSDIFTDPLFWQSLGKARGWVFNFKEADDSIYNQWERIAKQWFETRLSNGDEEKFWQSLP